MTRQTIAFLVLLIINLIVVLCYLIWNLFRKKEKRKEERYMDLDVYRSMVDENLVTPMLDMLDDYDDVCGYSHADIDRCEGLLLDYLDALEAMDDPDDDAIMELVKNLVLALNDLNESTDYSLIETSEREAIWEIIQHSALDCGLSTTEEDITGEWRDW